MPAGQGNWCVLTVDPGFRTFVVVPKSARTPGFATGAQETVFENVTHWALGLAAVTTTSVVSATASRGVLRMRLF
jgi:hypothetical protein